MPWNLWSPSKRKWMLLASVRSKAAAVSEIKTFQDDDLEPRRVRPMLEQHGTTIVAFKPEAIWRMAMADLDRRTFNRSNGFPQIKHYHFHRDHVRGAETANDILRAALADIERGRQSDKPQTRLLYADEDLLRRALQ